MREGRGKETGKRREAEEEEGSSAAEEAGGKADSRVRFGKAEEAGGIPGGRGSSRRRRRQQPGAAADGRWGRRLEAEQVLQGPLRGMGGRLVDSSRGAAKPQAELEVRPPPAIFLSPRPHSR